MQFRSASSPTALCVAPVISIPPTLMTQPDRANLYWVTLDEPSPAPLLHGGDGFACANGAPATGGGGGNGGGAAPWSSQPPSSPRGSCADGAAGAGGAAGASGYASSTGTGTAGAGAGAARGASDAGSEPATPQRVTTFNLLPEENPFQDITVGSLLGWGSFGRVHRGYWNGMLVAIKILEQIAGDFNPRTALEPLLHHRLSHPNIVKMFDISTQEVDVCEDGRPLQEVWMVLEYCNRGTLADAATRGALCMLPGPQGTAAAAPSGGGGGGGGAGRGVPDVPRIVRLVRDVASAMAYLHSENVLHGDLNGNNILLVAPQPGQPGQPGDLIPKVADFGLSRLLPLDSDRIVTRTHGTITHMAPEVITQSLHSKAADVYSFGVVLWELLTTAKPYSGMHYAQIVHAISESKGLDVPAQAPQALQQLLRSCLAPRPQDRPSFARVLERLTALEAEGFGDEGSAAGVAQAGAPPAAPAAAGRDAAGEAAAGAPPAAAEPPCRSCDAELMRQATADPPLPQAQP